MAIFLVLIIQMNILNRIMDAIETLKSSVLCQSDLQLEYPNEK